MTHAGGRPSLYTQELADYICEQLAEGKSMRTVAKEENMPSMQTIFSWLRIHQEFLEQYTRAKEEAADLLVEEMLEIADETSRDTIDTDTGQKQNAEWINRSRLRVDTRKWVASKLKPKKYGDKVDVTTNGKDIVQPILGGASVGDEDVRSDNSNE